MLFAPRFCDSTVTTVTWKAEWSLCYHAYSVIWTLVCEEWYGMRWKPTEITVKETRVYSQALWMLCLLETNVCLKSTRWVEDDIERLGKVQHFVYSPGGVVEANSSLCMLEKRCQFWMVPVQCHQWHWNSGWIHSNDSNCNWGCRHFPFESIQTI